MKINDFSGGLNKRIDPTLLFPNEAQVYENVDGHSGPLKSAKDKLQTDIQAEPFYTYCEAKKRWVSVPYEAQFLEFNDELYLSGEDGMYIYDFNTNKRKAVGLVMFHLKPEEITDLSIYISVNVTNSFQGQTGDLPRGQKYIYTIIVESPDTSIPKKKYVKEFSYYLDSGDIIAISVNLLTEGHFDNNSIVTVYRRDDYEFLQIGEKTFTGSTLNFIDKNYNIEKNPSDKYFYYSRYSNNEYKYLFTFYDSATGIESAPSQINTIKAHFPSVSYKIIAISPYKEVDKIRVYRIGGSITQFTLIDEIPNSVNKYYNFKSDSEIAGNHILESYLNYPPPARLRYITQAYAIIFGAQEDKLYFSETAKPYAWPKTNYIDFSNRITGIAPVSDGILVFTEYKTHIIIGNTPKTFSSYLLNNSNGCISIMSIVDCNQGVMWLSHNGLCYCSGGGITVVTYQKLGIFSPKRIYRAAQYNDAYYIVYIDDNDIKKVFCYDFKYNKIIQHFNFDGDNFLYAKGELYIHASDNKLYKPFKDSSDLRLKYRSPKYTEGEMTNRKIYKNVFIYYDGDFTFKVLIDGILINVININGNAVYNLKLNAFESHGYYIEFDISGKGKIFEIEYKVEGRKNANP